VGQVDTARGLYERALILARPDDSDPLELAEIQFGLARALATREPSRSAELVAKAEAAVMATRCPRGKRLASDVSA